MSETGSAYYDEHVETMPRSDLQSLQEEAILKLVPFAYERGGLVRSLWDSAGVHPRDIKSLEDYQQKAPRFTKNDLRDYRAANSDPFAGLLCQPYPRMRNLGLSSGTTGDPTPIPLAEHLMSNIQLRRDFWHIGMRPGDYFVYQKTTFKRGQEVDRFADCDFRGIVFAHSPDEMRRVLEASERFQPKLLHHLSRPLIQALEEIDRRGEVDLKAAFASYRGVVHGGEPPAPRVAALLKTWGLELFDFTSLGDISGAMECRAHDGMHAWEDFAFVECLDPGTGEPVPDNAIGELVVTALQDDIAPLVRFRSDDLVSVDRSRCACGRTHARIKVHGRLGDQVVVEGRSILPRDLMPIMDHVPEMQCDLFQIIRPQRELDVLRLRIGVTDLQGADSGLASRVAALIRETLEVPAEIEMVEEATLLKLGPPHKIPRVTKQ